MKRRRPADLVGFRFRRTLPLDFSRFKSPNASRLTIAKFSGPWSARMRLSSSRKVASRVQWSPFSMP